MITMFLRNTRMYYVAAPDEPGISACDPIETGLTGLVAMALDSLIG